MTNILIVDDNHLVIDSLENKLNAELTNINILKATSYQQSIKYILDKTLKIDIAIVDLNLPDVSDGAVANFSIKKHIPTIVLTALDDDKTKEFITRDSFLDYIKKDDYKGYDVAVGNIVRFLKNSQTNVLVVDDSHIQRSHLAQMLEDLQLHVSVAANGQEALKIIEKKETTFSLVLTDYEMPIMDGMELTVKLREKFGKDELGIIALSANGSEEIPTRFLKLGANDFLTKPLTKLEVNTRINANLETLELFQKVRNLANKDFLTGAYNRRYFFDSGLAIHHKANRKNLPLAVAMLDIDKFKNINDTYGHDVGDVAIKEVVDILNTNLRASDLMARFGGEEFCILLEDISQENTIKLFEKIRKIFENNRIQIKDIEIHFTVSIGISYGLDDLDTMITLADAQLYHCKENGRNQISLIGI